MGVVSAGPLGYTRLVSVVVQRVLYPLGQLVS